MLKELERLSTSELEQLVKAPLLVCILIAGADNEIDNKELKGAIELAKKGKAKASISEFYKIATEDFEDKLKIILQSLPFESTQRNPLLFDELSKLNSIFPKIEKTFATDFYTSLRYIAKKIAESSGGVLGMKSVGDEEMEFISLPMINDPSIHKK
jgi:hypothetical protein